MIRPLRDYIVVRPLEVVESTVIQVVQLDRKPARGEVMAVGPGKRNKRGGYIAWGAKVRGHHPVHRPAHASTRRSTTTALRLLMLQEADICSIEEPEEQAA